MKLWLRIPLGLAAVALGACLVCVNTATLLRAWDVAEQGLPLLNMVSAMLALGILGAGVDLLARQSPASAPQKPPLTRDAWDGGFQDMDSASPQMAKKDH